jgi:diketogulonate reductase-like aldo/keto reductase
MLLWLKPGHACDPIACLSGVRFTLLPGASTTVNHAAPRAGFPQVDLVLQHFPCKSDAENQAVWSGLVQAKALGLTRAIGVSHYTVQGLEAILALNKGMPVVNQCGMCLGDHDDATIK